MVNKDLDLTSTSLIIIFLEVKGEKRDQIKPEQNDSTGFKQNVTKPGFFKNSFKRTKSKKK